MDISSNIYNTLLKLCSLRSTSGTKEEALAAEGIYSIISDIGYFKEHRDKLMLHPIKDDPFGRSYITAFLEVSPSKRILVLMSHFDVVDVEEFGSLKKYAYSPEEYTRALEGTNLPDDAKEDLKTGDWLFGRGTLDMKCGLSIHIELLRYIYENKIDLDGNVLLLTVPDEENSSAGMLSAAEYLSALKDEGWDIVSAINSEPFFEEHPGDTNRYIYTGTIGKVLPFVFSAGVISHAGEPFEGISSSLMSSAVTYLMEDNTALCDYMGDYITPPPVCLKQEDLKKLYSVSTPDFSYSYYNYMTVSSTPEKVMENMKSICSKAFKMAIDKIRDEYESYSIRCGQSMVPFEMEPKVITFDELCSILRNKNIDIEKIMERYKTPSFDMQEATALITADMLRLLPDLRPVMVIGFAPPYYPHRTASGDSITMDICSKVIKRSSELYNDRMIQKDIMQGLCDLSYLGFENPEEYYALKDNMPLFESVYNFPVKALSNIDIDGMNIGVMGRDCHRYTERLYMPYSLHVTPDLVLFAIKEFLS